MMRNLSAYKILILCFLLLLLSFILVNSIYKSILSEQWDEQNEAIRTAFAQTELVSASHAEPFSFDEYYMIVFGKNSEQQDMIVWVGEEEIHSELAKDGYNKNLLRLKMRETHPNLEIIKMTPGKYRQDWVWEVLYKPSTSADRTYYDYYRFSDGELLVTLTMSPGR